MIDPDRQVRGQISRFQEEYRIAEAYRLIEPSSSTVGGRVPKGLAEARTARASARLEMAIDFGYSRSLTEPVVR